MPTRTACVVVRERSLQGVKVGLHFFIFHLQNLMMSSDQRYIFGKIFISFYVKLFTDKQNSVYP